MAEHHSGTVDEPGDPLVVSESEALTLLAHLVTSAELCMTEPYDYGIFRLIDAASRLARAMVARSSGESRAFLEEVDVKKIGRPETANATGRSCARRADGLLNTSWPGRTDARLRRSPRIRPAVGMPSEPRPGLAETVLETIRSRRVTRLFDDHPVADESLLQVLEAGRWATSGGNRRIHPFLVVRDPRTLARLRAVTPGMFSTPPVVIVICTDATRAAEELVQLEHDTTTWIDVGTAAMNMMVAAHALELGSCPVTSFSHGAVSVVLGLPPTVEPELFLLLGHPHEPTRPVRPTGSGRTGAAALPPGLVWWEQPGCATPELMPIQGGRGGAAADLYHRSGRVDRRVKAAGPRETG